MESSVIAARAISNVPQDFASQGGCTAALFDVFDQLHNRTVPKRLCADNTIPVIPRRTVGGDHGEMDATTARTLNIRDLVAAAGGPTRFAEKYNGGKWSQAQVSQWISEDRPKGIGARLARTIEAETGNHKGWLDTYPHEGADSAKAISQMKVVLATILGAIAEHGPPVEGRAIADALRRKAAEMGDPELEALAAIAGRHSPASASK